MAEYRYIVRISAETEEQADAAINELCALQRIETDLPRFTYEAHWTHTPGHQTAATTGYQIDVT